MKYLMLLLSLTLLDTQPTNDDFVPKDMDHAVAIGCEVSGDAGPPPFAEVQVFVKYGLLAKGWDFKPVLSRRDVSQGGILKAIDDCTEWYSKVKKKIQATKDTKGSSK
jgi:hypothetical protein